VTEVTPIKIKEKTPTQKTLTRHQRMPKDKHRLKKKQTQPIVLMTKSKGEWIKPTIPTRKDTKYQEIDPKSRSKESK
jgi:hypothetical protein